MKLILDQYNGLTIDSSTLPINDDKFEEELLSILEEIQNKHLLWIKVPILKSSLIPILTKHDFIFHHCNQTDITLLKKITTNPIIPTAKNHTLGVGAVVINEDNELLVIKDRFNIGYKLPGGHIDDEENISNALCREVLEETGIKVKFDSIVTLGHFTNAQFGESNLYIICKAKALNSKINIQDTDEIIEAKWLSLDTFLNDDSIHSYNKHLVKTAIDNSGLKLIQNNYMPNKQHELFS